MSKLTKKDFETARQAAQHLSLAQKPIRILRSLSWEPSIGEAFLAAKGRELPRVAPIVFKGKTPLMHVGKARRLLVGDNPVFDWLGRVADKLELAVGMLENTGTPAFYAYSRQIYGTPTDLMLDRKTTTLSLARHMEDTLAELSPANLVLGDEGEMLDANDLAKELRVRIRRAFPNEKPKVIIADNLSAKALASSRRIRINRAARFSKMDIRQLWHHEAMIHTATAMNGRSQEHFTILGSAHAGTTEIQEGLAVFAEMITGALDPKRFHRLVDRVMAIQMSVEGADFIDVYQYFLGQSDDPEQSFEDTRRVFRGGVLTGGAPFTKDGVYLNGLLRVHNFMRTIVALGRADLIRLLFVGKLDIEDVPALACLAENGYLNAPQVVPPWIRDMRFLVSYLAYSSFLNKVRLPGFQDYYNDLLKEVPKVWAF